MKLLYVLDYIFNRTPDGRIWTDTSYDAAFWEPYFQVYSHVTIVSRVQDSPAQEIGWKQVTAERVSVAAVPLYTGALQYVTKSRMVSARLRTLFADADGIILRVPSNLARCAAKELDRMGCKYAVDVVGDPYEALAPGVVQMAGRPILRRVFTRAQKTICSRAVAVAYVAETLRARYPERSGALSLVCSDVRLDADWMRRTPRRHGKSRRVHLLTVATLSQAYKGLDVLLKSVSICREQGARFYLTIVGRGRYREQLEKTVMELGIADSVLFTGSIPWGPQLIARFDSADVFVLPSRVEVLPRALLEAMARGLPAIATRVGAVPEILSPEDTVAAGDAEALATRLLACVGNATMLDTMSARNLERSQHFASAKLDAERHQFHLEVRRLFERGRVQTMNSLAKPAVA